MIDLLVDNDVIIKLAQYGLLNKLYKNESRPMRLGVLGAARYVVLSALARRGTAERRAVAARNFTAFVAAVAELEPTAEELVLSTSIQEAALTLGVSMDAGESQLCAMALYRDVPAIVTGDKRAIGALETVQANVTALQGVRGRVVCLEQVVLGIAIREGKMKIRRAICAEPSADRALTNCAECSAGDDIAERFDFAGLASYVRHLRSNAPTILYSQESWRP